MSSGALWGIAGIIVTIVVAFLIYKLQKIRKYPSQLSYTILDESRVLKHVPDSFDALALKYNDYSVSEDMHYIEFMIFNPRTSDVGNDKSRSAVTISLPDNSKWVDIRIKQESPSVGSSVSTQHDSTAELTFGLLKVNEAIILEGLIESSYFPQELEGRYLSLEHHICNLDKFRFSPTFEDYQYEQSVKTMKRISLIMLFLTVYVCLVLFLPVRTGILYRDSLDNKLYSVTIDRNGLFVAKDPNSLFIRSSNKFSYDVFTERFEPTFEYKRLSFSFLFDICGLYLIGIVVVALMSSSFIRRIVYYRRSQKVFANLRGIERK